MWTADCLRDALEISEIKKIVKKLSLDGATSHCIKKRQTEIPNHRRTSRITKKKRRHKYKLLLQFIPKKKQINKLIN